MTFKKGKKKKWLSHHLQLCFNMHLTDPLSGTYNNLWTVLTESLIHHDKLEHHIKLKCIFEKEILVIILILGSLILILDSCRATRHNWTVKSVYLQKIVTRTLFPLFSAFSQNGLCWLLLLLFLLCARLHTQLYSQLLYWHKIHTARTLTKCYL